MHSVQKKRKEEDENTMIRGSEYICLVVPECYQPHLPTALCDHTHSHKVKNCGRDHTGYGGNPKKGRKKKREKKRGCQFFCYPGLLTDRSLGMCETLSIKLHLNLKSD